MSTKIQRINISFPKKVADELSCLVPSGKRSSLVVEATRKELQKVKLLKVLDRTAGTWTDRNHPDLQTIEDVKTWVQHLRRSDQNRSFHNTKAK
jgi:metal-responsive CopG/Arc/MetJ family transcriptional regulator